jgi:hypothetical protein
MNHLDNPASSFEASAEDFTRIFTFDVEDGLRKSVTVARSGRRFVVEIRYIDGAVTDTTEETFEADGPVRISVVDSGLYLASYRVLLAERVRLRRTRFF